MIYCLEDDDDSRRMVVYTLNASGLTAEGFGDGAAFWQAMAKAQPQLVLLDIMLPGGQDGLQILRRLKADPATASIPVIMTTAKTTEYDKVSGLDQGADDYLAKPFGMMEMVSHVKAVLRRTAPTARVTKLSCGRLAMDLDRHVATADGRPVALTLKEFELLRTLMADPQHVFSRDQLLTSIWGYDFDGETRTVDVHVRTLRRKLGPAGEGIQTVRGLGYSLRPDHD